MEAVLLDCSITLGDSANLSDLAYGINEKTI